MAFEVTIETLKAFCIVRLRLVRKSQAIDSILYFLGCQLFDLLSKKTLSERKPKDHPAFAIAKSALCGIASF